MAASYPFCAADSIDAAAPNDFLAATRWSEEAAQMHDEMRRLDDDCLPRNVLLTQGALRLFACPTIYGDTSRRDAGEAAVW